jgi:hypothetical protein
MHKYVVVLHIVLSIDKVVQVIINNTGYWSLNNALWNHAPLFMKCSYAYMWVCYSVQLPNSIPRYAQYISVKYNQQYHINVGWEI